MKIFLFFLGILSILLLLLWFFLDDLSFGESNDALPKQEIDSFVSDQNAFLNALGEKRGDDSDISALMQFKNKMKQSGEISCL